MTDLEMTKLCAEAMRLKEYAIPMNGGNCDPKPITLGPHYNPLHDDAQAMALVKRFNLSMWGTEQGEWRGVACWRNEVEALREFSVYSTDLNRAIVECVAKMQQAKETA